MSYNFLNEKSQLAEQYEKQKQAIKDKNDAAQEKYKQRVNQPLDFLGGGLTEDSVVPLLKNALKTGGEKVASKIGLSEDTIKNLSSKLDSLKTSDLKNPKQALKKLLKAIPPIPNVQFFKKCLLLLTEAFFNKNSLNSFVFLSIIKHELRIHLNSLLHLQLLLNQHDACQNLLCLKILLSFQGHLHID